jgi:hypothetical protein
MLPVLDASGTVEGDTALCENGVVCSSSKVSNFEWVRSALLAFICR